MSVTSRSARSSIVAALTAISAMAVVLLALAAACGGDDSSPAATVSSSAAASPTISPSPTPFVVLADMGCESETALRYAEQYGPLESDGLLPWGLYSVGADGSDLRCLAAGVRDSWWSTNSQRLAVTYLTISPPYPGSLSPTPGAHDPVWLEGPWKVAPTLGIYDLATDSWNQLDLGPWRRVLDAQWSSDGEIVAVSLWNTEEDKVTEIWIFRDGGMTQELLATLTEPFAWIHWIESDQLSVVASESGEPHRLLVIDIATGAERTIARWSMESTETVTPVVSWSPESDRVALISEDGDMTTLRVADLVSGGVEDVYQFEHGERVDLGTFWPNSRSTWSPDGFYVAAATDERMILIAADGSGVVSVAEMDTGRQIRAWSWSSHEATLAIELGTADRAFEYDILIAELDGPTKLVEGGSDAQWSPDGSKLLFARGVCSDQWDLVVLDLTTGTEHIISVDQPGLKLNFEWMPDGKRVSFYDLGSDTIYIVDWRGDEISKVTPGGTFTLSPDGSRLTLQPLLGLDACF